MIVEVAMISMVLAVVVGGGGNAGAGGLDTFLGPTAVAPRLSNSRACTGCSCTARKLSQTPFSCPSRYPLEINRSC